MQRPYIFLKESTKGSFTSQNPLHSDNSSWENSRKLDGLRESKQNLPDQGNLCSKEWWKKMKANTRERELKDWTLKSPTLLTIESASIPKARNPNKAPCFQKRTKIFSQPKKILTLNIVKLSRSWQKTQQHSSVSASRWIALLIWIPSSKKLKGVPDKWTKIITKLCFRWLICPLLELAQIWWNTCS